MVVVALQLLKFTQYCITSSMDLDHVTFPLYGTVESCVP